jgi:hypothetical protein
MPKQEGQNPGPNLRRSLLSKAINSSSRLLIWEESGTRKSSTKPLVKPNRQKSTRLFAMKLTSALGEQVRCRDMIRKSCNTRRDSMDNGATVEETLAILLERELRMMDY